MTGLQPPPAPGTASGEEGAQPQPSRAGALVQELADELGINPEALKTSLKTALEGSDIELDEDGQLPMAPDGAPQSLLKTTPIYRKTMCVKSKQGDVQMVIAADDFDENLHVAI